MTLILKFRQALFIATLSIAGATYTSHAMANVSAPSNMAGTQTNGLVTLTWDASSTATGYNVYKNNQYLATVTDGDTNFEESLASGEVAC